VFHISFDSVHISQFFGLVALLSLWVCRYAEMLWMSLPLLLNSYGRWYICEIQLHPQGHGNSWYRDVDVDKEVKTPYGQIVKEDEKIRKLREVKSKKTKKKRPYTEPPI